MAKKPWYDLPRDEVYKTLHPYLTTLEARQKYREQDNVYALGLYEDREVLGVAPGLYTRPQRRQRNRISLNVTGAMCDAATNKIAQSRPLPMALTEGGDWTQQQRAKQLNRFVEGGFYKYKIHTKMQQAFRDETIFGTGILHVFDEDGDINVERVFPNEIVVDDYLCEFAPPQQLTRRRYLPKDKVLAIAGPKYAAAIEAAKPVRLGSGQYVSELIPVYESWRLPASKEAKGRHVVIIETATLQDEVYTEDHFPFAFMRFRPQPAGFWGEGLPGIVGNIQEDLNRFVRTYSKSVHLTGVPRLMYQQGSINTEMLTNDIATGIPWTGASQPAWLTGNPIPPEALPWIQMEIQQMYQLGGMNEFSVGQKKPAGLDSGEAQRVYNDTQADRFALVAQGYEEAAVEIGRLMINCARRIAKAEGDFEISYQTTKGFKRIKWSDVELSEDEYVLKLWPINLLSKSPEDQLARMNDMVEMGLLTTKQARRLISFPDIEGVLALENAPEDLTEMIIEEIIEHDNYVPPDPIQDLDEAVKTMQFAALRYQTQGCPQNKLDMMHAWIAQASSLVPPAPAGPPQGGPPAGNAPPPAGGPMPPPGAMPPPQAPPMQQAA